MSDATAINLIGFVFVCIIVWGVVTTVRSLPKKDKKDA